MAKHKHAELMLAYAQDAQKSDKPWMLWEYTLPNRNGWRPLKDNPSWDYTLEYRRKVKTIRIGAYDVPEPLRVAPEIGEGYYYVDCCSFPNFRHSIFAEDDFDYRIFIQGMMHLTEEAAELHAKALVSLTKL